MATEWFYFKGNQRIGPIGSQQLKELASKGSLQPTDLVWKEGMANPLPAANVKGLIDPFMPPSLPPSVVQSPSIAQLPPPMPPVSKIESTLVDSAPAKEKTHEEKDADAIALMKHPAIIAISLTCCCPLGLFLLWTHPTWSQMQKFSWTGGWLFILLFLSAIAKDRDKDNGGKERPSSVKEDKSLAVEMKNDANDEQLAQIALECLCKCKIGMAEYEVLFVMQNTANVVPTMKRHFTLESGPTAGKKGARYAYGSKASFYFMEKTTGQLGLVHANINGENLLPPVNPGGKPIRMN